MDEQFPVFGFVSFDKSTMQDGQPVIIGRAIDGQLAAFTFPEEQSGRLMMLLQTSAAAGALAPNRRTAQAAQPSGPVRYTVEPMTGGLVLSIPFGGIAFDILLPPADAKRLATELERYRPAPGPSRPSRH